ncbi:hypothetical protein FRB96_006002 [Tulasnella sp. 330]|nr:hypothetical protein FRB96_006002 [Tulasnella sp. 330]
MICLVLLGLTIYAANTVSNDKLNGPSLRDIQETRVVFYIYASLLGLLTVLGYYETASVSSVHLTILLPVPFAVLVYRDVIPLAMLAKVSQDGADGWITWARISLLFVAGVAIPLITPRRYTLIDPMNPAIPAPEQTASLLSYSLYTYIDYIVSKGYCQSHVGSEELPPVPDYGRIGHLAAQAFPHLDTSVKVGRSRHIFFSLMRVYKWDYLKFTTFLVLKSCSSLIWPFAMNHLLQYMESGGKDAIFYPWVWILALIAGLFLGSILFQLHLSIGTRILVRTEGLMTQLIFEHAIYGDAHRPLSQPEPEPEPETSITSSDDDTATERTQRAEGTESSVATLSGDSETREGDNKGKGECTSPKSSGSDSLPKAPTDSGKQDLLKKSDAKGETKNLVGRLTNLASNDPKNITEAISVIRMIKFFGWEDRVQKKIEEKRNEELKYMKRRTLWNIGNYCVKINETDLLDHFTKPEQDISALALPPARDSDSIGFRNATFTWKVKSGIPGPTGSGKTSLLMYGVAFYAQEPWIQNATIRENLLFGSPYEEVRYQKVIHQCALEADLALFDAGDATEVGEKGLPLSGGQKPDSFLRVSYTLPPPSFFWMISFQPSTSIHPAGKWPSLEQSGWNQMLKTAAQTHNIGMMAALADLVVSVGSNGRVTSQDTILDALIKHSELREISKNEAEIEKKEEQVVDAMEKPSVDRKRSSGQLVAKEEVAEGKIVWSACYWAKQYETRPGSEVNAVWYLSSVDSLCAATSNRLMFNLRTMYGLIIVLGLSCFAVGYVIFLLGKQRATRPAHTRLTKAILHAPLRWLDSTPSGRIIARFTQDITAIETSVSNTFYNLIGLSTSLLLKFISVLIYSPIFMFPGIAVGAWGAWIGSIYMTAQLPVKREMSNARSRVYSHFNAAMAGLTSIRAYGAEEVFRTEGRKRIDGYTRPARAFWDLNRWDCIRIDILGGSFAGFLAMYLVYWRTPDASIAGFSLTMTLSFTNILLYWVRVLNMFQVEGNSLERIKAYVDIDQGPQPVESRKPAGSWPSSGSILVERLSAKWGRTGVGKSSLSLAFLRMIPTTGKLFYDGVDTSEINLDALRNNITIIPQQPELMSGSLRQNLVSEKDDENKIHLDTEVTSGGTSFSVGQRQIVALARAMVRRSKVYILGESPHR